MNRIELGDIKNILEYEREREAFRERIIQVKKRRRVLLGDSISLVFEGRDTVLFQIQEMVRAERIVDEAKLQEEIDVYAPMLPQPRCLSATLFIEIEDQSRIKQSLEGFLGITRAGTIYIDVGGARVNGEFEGGREEEESGKVSAVQYVRFPFQQEPFEKFGRQDVRVAVVADHPNYKARTELDGGTQEELRQDIAEK
ncbi:MAG: DUF3501 family protein [Blastocatellia bacterium]